MYEVNSLLFWLVGKPEAASFSLIGEEWQMKFPPSPPAHITISTLGVLIFESLRLWVSVWGGVLSTGVAGWWNSQILSLGRTGSSSSGWFVGNFLVTVDKRSSPEGRAKDDQHGFSALGVWSAHTSGMEPRPPVNMDSSSIYLLGAGGGLNAGGVWGRTSGRCLYFCLHDVSNWGPFIDSPHHPFCHPSSFLVTHSRAGEDCVQSHISLDFFILDLCEVEIASAHPHLAVLPFLGTCEEEAF